MKIANSIFAFFDKIGKAYKVFGIVMETVSFAKKRLIAEGLLTDSVENKPETKTEVAQ